MTRRLPAVLIAVLAVAPGATHAHEVLHELRPGGALALKAYFPDGEVLAYSAYEIWSPVDPKIPYQKGRTDRLGWLSFVPDVPGRWRVKVIEEGGHGLDLEIDTTTLASAGAKSSSSNGAAGSVHSAAFVLRPILGVAIIAALFLALIALYRRRRTQSPP